MAEMRLQIDETIRRVLMPLRDDELQLLEQSVLAEGIRDPLVVWKRADGTRILLDGHHRYQLAQKHGLDFSIVEMEFDDESHAVQWVLRNQLARRNLTDEQRTLLIGRLYNQMKLAPHRPPADNVVKLTTFSGAAATSRYVASLHGAGEKTVRRAAEFAKAVDAVAEVEPKAAEAILLGKVPDAKTALPKVEPDQLPQVAQILATNQARTVKDAVRTIKHQSVQNQTHTNPTTQLPSTIQLYTGDFREALATLPPESVDAIITDPPYLSEHIPLFEPLAEHAARLLKPHGVLVVMVAHLYLYEYITLLNQHLRYRWICVYHMGDTKARVSAAKIAASWKPLLVYVRHDAENLRFVCSDYFSAARGTADGVQKELHHWQQSLDGFIQIVERFTEPGDIVLDPFMGSGTTGVACLYLNRRFIGCDNDPSAAAVAAKRIRETHELLSSEAAPRLV
jgi:methylase of polypeptide subunit release factors